MKNGIMKTMLYDVEMGTGLKNISTAQKAALGVLLLKQVFNIYVGICLL